jgi:hypothetical protein
VPDGAAGNASASADEHVVSSPTRVQRVSGNSTYDPDLFLIEVDDVDLVDCSRAEEALRRLCCSPWSQRPRPNRVEIECLQLASHGHTKPHVMSRRFQPGDAFSRRVLHEARQERHLGPDLRSIGHALSTVGTAGMRRCILESSVRRAIFHDAAVDGPMWGLYRHTIAVSAIARALARDHLQNAEDVADAALFHDAGVVVALQQAMGERDALGLSDPVELVFGVASVRAELTMQCAENWRLGDGAHTLLVDLHRSRDATDLHPGVALVVLAEELALRLGFAVGPIGGLGPHDQPSGPALAWARQSLGIGALEETERRARAALQRIVTMT